MRTSQRRRRYLPASRLALCRPLIEYDDARDAWILRAVGDRVGPVLREDRRLTRAAEYAGDERRGAALRPRARDRRGSALQG